MPPITVLTLLVALAAPLQPVTESPSKIAQPAATTGGAPAEAPADTRTSPPAEAGAALRVLWLRLGEELDVTPKEQVMLDGIVASLRAGEKRKADRAWKKLIETHHARTGSTDPNALVQFVLREAYLDTSEDLKAIADKIAEINAAKKALREHLRGIREAVAAKPPSTGSIALPTVVVCKKCPPGKKLVASGTTKTLTAAQWDSYAAKREQELQTLGDMTQTQSMRLQDLLQKQQQMFALLSAMLKAYNETAKAIISNMK